MKSELLIVASQVLLDLIADELGLGLDGCLEIFVAVVKELLLRELGDGPVWVLDCSEHRSLC